ncbi:hypothetical protein BCR33DRAFT_853048 [Rhizoclosmatium globosum]|uniref:COP9 signalosome complex subunit 3 N-terminal helical repeats domain-containing protein n=1 Tax=Rhizoclosmatium globosum TaxID=329046 RepID=A0A1Y2BZ48_9FUNG|nr:hypothetical protein BCR33DRAFT_853048 [Rhizoclosmatium globosum]|eukprot:ORY39917.1 hypothetical protein BCR33DRAFT_853048 [Rhizoclosmatium globosum]
MAAPSLTLQQAVAIVLDASTPSEQLVSSGPSSFLRAVRGLGDSELASFPIETLLNSGQLSQPFQAPFAVVLLSARLRSSATAAHQMFSATELATRLLPQTIQGFNDALAQFANAIAAFADRERNPRLAVAPLRNILTRIQTISRPGHHSLTKIHTLFLKYAILAKMHSYALPVVMNPLTAIEKSTHHVSITDFLLYSFYAGTLLSALKRYDDAVHHFRVCLAAPSKSGASAIQVEAWKKGSLVYFLSGPSSSDSAKLEKGGVARCMSTVVTRVVADESKKKLGEFLKNLENGKYQDLVGEVERLTQSLQNGHNLGLARQCINKSLAHRQILKLTKTYLTLSLPSILSSVSASLPPAHQSPAVIRKYLMELIESGKVAATIDESVDGGGMVTFHDSTSVPGQGYDFSVLEGKMREVVGIYERLSEMDRAVGASKEYLVKVAVVGDKGDRFGGYGGSSSGMGGLVSGMGSGMYGGASFDSEAAGDDDVLMDDDDMY